jgi:hypothetical protein
MEEIKMKSKGSDVNTPTEDNKVTGNVTDEEREYVEDILRKLKQNRTSGIWTIARVFISILTGFLIGQLIINFLLK